MSIDERLTKIGQAQTRRELDQALDGYHEQVIANHSNLQLNYPFNLALERKQYFHALCDLKRAARGSLGNTYQEVIQILEIAADKQLSLGEL